MDLSTQGLKNFTLAKFRDQIKLLKILMKRTLCSSAYG